MSPCNYYSVRTLFNSVFVTWTPWANLWHFIFTFYKQWPCFMIYLVLIFFILHWLMKVLHIFYSPWLFMNWTISFAIKRWQIQFVVWDQVCLFRITKVVHSLWVGLVFVFLLSFKTVQFTLVVFYVQILLSLFFLSFSFVVLSFKWVQFACAVFLCSPSASFVLSVFHFCCSELLVGSIFFCSFSWSHFA